MRGRPVHRLKYVAPPELAIVLTRGAINITLLAELKNELNQPKSYDERHGLVTDCECSAQPRALDENTNTAQTVNSIRIRRTKTQVRMLTLAITPVKLL